MLIQDVIKEEPENVIGRFEQNTNEMPSATVRNASARSFSNSPTSPHATEISSGEVESNPEGVRASGYGLSTGVAGQQNSFKLDARNAGFGDFDVVIKGASRATIEYMEEEEALYKIKYHVALPGDYQIEIKYDLKHIPGSPFKAKILDPNTMDNQKLDCSSTHTASMESFSTLNEISDDDSSIVGRVLQINGTVETPSGKIITGSVVQKPNGKITVKFARTETGLYKVTLRHKKTGDLIRGSPYEVMVRAKEVGTSYTACGTGLKEAKVDATNCFTVFGANGIDVKNLCILMHGTGPGKLKVFQNDWDSVDVLYEVKRSGCYIFFVHENGKDITGSPFTVSTLINNKEKNVNTFSAITLAVWHGQKYNDHRIQTEITSSDGHNSPHTISKRGRHLFEVKFLPSQNGNYVLEIFKDDISLNQTFTINIDNISKHEDVINLKGDGLSSALIGEPAYFYINCMMPLKVFSVEMDGPSTVQIVQKRLENGQCTVEYTGNTPGRYVMSIKYDGFHVGKSPYYINMYSDVVLTKNAPLAIQDKPPVASDASKCIAEGKALHMAISGDTTSFTVNTTQAGDGGLMAGFSASSTPTEVLCKNIGNNLYKVQYTISKPGTYKLTVLWAGKDIPGSPFGISVSDRNNN